MRAALRFIWNSTRGHHFAPWRSEYLKWRIETFTGVSAERLTGFDVISFLWATRWEILSFLGWINQTNKEVARVSRKSS